jgi:LuxR family transcriptional regulator, maltose regulon positive regulatory protein
MLSLRALLDDLRGDRAAAVAGVGEAVALAEPAGLIRIFVELGPPMAVLLRQVAARTGLSEYLRRVVAAFGEDAVSEPQIANKPALAKVYAGGPALPQTPHTSEEDLVEPLSGREIQVLELLASWCTNKEIARELHIAPSTVKRHTVNIYEKLQVGGRRHAVARAAALGLIEPPEYGIHYRVALN